LVCMHLSLKFFQKDSFIGSPVVQRTTTIWEGLLSFQKLAVMLPHSLRAAYAV
jgi:hypothetical protein